jgi:hypothetical protein
VREALGGLAMSWERLDDDIIRDPEKWLLREQAQAMLDLFAKDCGRTPVTLEEVCEWARGQDEKHLRFRINHRVSFLMPTKIRRIAAQCPRLPRRRIEADTFWI